MKKIIAVLCIFALSAAVPAAQSMKVYTKSGMVSYTTSSIDSITFKTVTDTIIFDNGNGYAVSGVNTPPTDSTRFMVSRATVITYLQDYHYYNGGRLPGTISLKNSDGTMYGPFQTTGVTGQGGVANAYWVCYPDVTIKPGIYVIIDSDPSTWSNNSQSAGRGFSLVKGYPVNSTADSVYFNNGNIGGVSGIDTPPTDSTRFTLDTPIVVTFLQNYHYYNGGHLPGTITLKHADGTVYGPFQTTGTVGQGGVSNAYWNCYPWVTIKAGSYVVIDSDPSTWSHNSQSGGRGFTQVKGYPAK